MPGCCVVGLERKAAAVELDRIESHIPGRFEGLRPNLRIRLANGQVWQVVDDSRRLYDLENPKATIERGVFGVFYLIIADESRTTRVKRVERATGWRGPPPGRPGTPCFV